MIIIFYLLYLIIVKVYFLQGKDASLVHFGQCYVYSASVLKTPLEMTLWEWRAKMRYSVNS